MFGILKITENKKTKENYKTYLKNSKNEVRLFDQKIADHVAILINQSEGKEYKNLKIYFKVVNYTTGMFTK